VSASPAVSRPSFLMCRPTFYGIEYEINPWMDIRRQADRARALRQWQALREVLEREINALILYCRARPGLPDMTFTANAGLVRGDTAIPSRFRYRERAGEAPRFTAWFRRRGYRIVRPPAELPFEGAGDALFVGDTLFCGYYHRSHIGTHAFLGEALHVRVLSLELVLRHFYHLDTCFSPIGPDAALHYPGAFDRYGRKVLRENIGDLVAVPADEAYRFGCNSVVVGKQAVIPAQCPVLEKALRRRGFRIYALDFSEFIKAGGAARCLTLRLA